MKHTKLYALISALLIAFGLSVFVGCSNDPSGNGGDTADIIERIDLNKYKTTLAVGETDTLTVRCTVAYTVSYESDDESIATVSADGVITGISEGVTFITATVNGTPIKVDVEVVRSNDYSPAYLFRFADSQVDLFVGDTNKLGWSLVYGDKAVENPQISYTSSDDEIATVSDDGTVTAVGYGKVEITAIVNGIEGEILRDTVTVSVMTKRYIAFTSDRITDGSLILSQSGDFVENDMKVVVYMINSDNDIVVDDATTALLTCTSSDESIVSVDGQVVKGVSKGTATVTVEVASIGLKETVDVKVYGYSLEISNAEEFAEIANHPDEYFELDSDIDLGMYNTGTSTNFAGVLNGNGHIITYATGAAHDKSLFGTMSGTVKNLGVVINTYAGNQVRIAAIANTNTGTIDNVYIKYSASVAGQATAEQWSKAGIVMTNRGTINNAVVVMNYTGDSSANILGFCALNDAGGVISNSALISVATEVKEQTKNDGSKTNVKSYTSVKAFANDFKAFEEAGFAAGELWSSDGSDVFFNETAIFGEAE